MERIGIGQERMSDRAISRYKLNTYILYWTYLDDMDLVNNTALREGSLKAL